MKQRTKRTWAACLAALWLVLPAAMQAQVHIGGNTDAVKGALLDLTTPEGANLGLLPLNVYIDYINQIPDVFTNKASINAGDLQGLIVYNINPDLPDGAGLYVWDGAKWNRVFIACTGAPTVGALTAPTVCIDGTLSMAANVISDNGSPVTKYEWKLGGTTIGTSASLSYAVATADNGKALTLSATNSCGTTTTTSVTLTVPDVFTQTNPAAATIGALSTRAITLAAATGGSGAITYNWQQSIDNSTWVNAEGTHNDANYTTPTLKTTMYYRRQATAATCGGTITSASAKITVTANGTTTIGNNTYAIYCYGGMIGCWMIENSKEGTASYTHATYGKYYLQNRANNACVSPWAVPTAQQWGLLAGYIDRGDATNAEKRVWHEGNALAGYYANSILYGAGQGAYWWADNGTCEWYEPVNGKFNNGTPAGTTNYTVRCRMN
ncbi:MAG: hypothetical protein LBO74_11490 [Candidatus Symbiothrix sp.]|nr:hypothetical protein [Candidatus Symbiothrix sp.]